MKTQFILGASNVSQVFATEGKKQTLKLLLMKETKHFSNTNKDT